MVDLAILAVYWLEDRDETPKECNQYNLPGDLNCDYTVDMIDLAIMASNWLEGNE